MIRVDFRDTYKFVKVDKEVGFMTFISPLKNGHEVLLKVNFSPLENLLLPDVYNLSFGPLNNDGSIDDISKLHHVNINKVFSTILLFCLIFLKRNPTTAIGIDGSNDARAYLYHRMFLTNKEYLEGFFNSTGVDWYARVLRNGTFELGEDGEAFLKPIAESFDYYRSTNDLYGFYMFNLV